MLNVMEYKGIRGMVRYVQDIKELQVLSVGTSTAIFVFGKTIEEIEQHFAEAVDEYLEKCKKSKIDPTPRIYGKLPEMEIDPDIHQKAIIQCRIEDKSMERIIEAALKKYIR
ncbi:MAG: hypothetical protein IJ365_03230 [Clostridia bacterium]|nr:hypothetical protein [Clostridia bacterium]